MNLYNITHTKRAPQTYDEFDGFGDYFDWTEEKVGLIEAANETEAIKKFLLFKPYYKGVKKRLEAVLVA